jgi:hypothetical protein
VLRLAANAIPARSRQQVGATVRDIMPGARIYPTVGRDCFRRLWRNDLKLDFFLLLATAKWRYSSEVAFAVAILGLSGP